jgi:hypothetical protein
MAIERFLGMCKHHFVVPPARFLGIDTRGSRCTGMAHMFRFPLVDLGVRAARASTHAAREEQLVI